jgi:hypothetical protein
MKRRISPKPWRVGYTTGGALGIWSAGCRADSPDVCDVASVPDATDDANAHLIAAAPELLAALKKLMVAYESVLPGIRYIAVQDYRIVNDAPVAAERAIQKAEGLKRADDGST